MNTPSIDTISDSALTIPIPMSARATVIRMLIDQVPDNEYGLPAYIYRADLIPPNFEDLNPLEQSDFAECATIELNYSQGFPTLPDGEPFWAVLPGEGHDAHRAFMHYLDMPRVSSRSASGKDGLATPVRQLHLLKTITTRTTSELMAWSTMYCWAQRVRAYDMFIMASHNKQKEYRLQEAENDHYSMASRYIQCAQEFLDRVFTDPETYELKPKEAMSLLKDMIQVQRLSLGVAPFSNTNGAKSRENALPQNASMEVILKTIAQNSGEAVKEETSQDVTKQLFDDPKALESAQELIIKLNALKNPRGQNASDPGEKGFFDAPQELA